MTRFVPINEANGREIVGVWQRRIKQRDIDVCREDMEAGRVPFTVDCRWYQQNRPPVTTMGPCPGCGQMSRGCGYCVECLDEIERLAKKEMNDE